jgi:hypothetical protein
VYCSMGLWHQMCDFVRYWTYLCLCCCGIMAFNLPWYIDALDFVVAVCRGESLNEWCSRVSPNFATTLFVLLHVAERLQQLHASGLCHRDLKCARALVCPAMAACFHVTVLNESVSSTTVHVMGAACRILSGRDNRVLTWQSRSMLRCCFHYSWFVCLKRRLYDCAGLLISCGCL